jgi:alpha-tubulin suppressor-like RCC1 family protein
MKRSASLPCILAVLGAACSSDPSGTGTAATRLVFQVAPASSARAGVALDPVPVVQLADNAGNAIAQRGVLVTASLVEGPGSVGGTASVRTADDGTASFPGLSIIAGVGVKTLRFSATGLGAARSDPINLLAGPPASAISLEGNNQSATAGTSLLIAPAVKVLDAGGNPVPGVEVRFEIVTGGGTITGGFATTGADGIARVESWTLGPAGVQSLRAIVEGLESQPVTFSATAVTPVPVAFVTGNNQAGFPGDTLSQEILFRLVTAQGVPRVGVTVTFTAGPGNGSFTETSIVTDANGTGRTRWILGTALGTQTATATAEGQGDGILTASAVVFAAIRAGGSGGTGGVNGGVSACGLTTMGAVYCWGSNSLSQLGDGTTINFRPRPGLVVGGHIFDKLEGAGGGNFYCAVEAGGAGWCWGSGRHGQLGDGTTPTGGSSSRSSPIAVAGGISWSQIDPGGDHACGRDLSGKAYCWGEGFSGQLGDGLGADQVTPVATSGGLTFTSLATGVSHSCGLTFFGDAYCWGAHTGFRAGSGASVLSPVLIPGGIKFAALVAGRSTCGLTPAGVAYCWGSNSSGQHGNGTTTSTSSPTLVSGGHVFVSLTMQEETTCGLKADGTAYCWGKNSGGQAGVGTTGSVRVPTAVLGGLRFTQLTAGTEITCGLVDPGISWCWGPNTHGQNGDGTLTPALVPTRTRF